MAASARAREFRGLQALRFVAAGSVLLHHSLMYANERLHDGVPVWGIGAVELFFAISGFVAVVSTRAFQETPGGWRSYVVRRGIRILPMYWIATTVKLAVLLAAPSLVLHAALDWPMVARSYVLLPSVNVDGDIAPLLGVAWTLLYESFFALVFALALALRWRPVLVAGIVLSACALAALLRPEEIPPWLVYFDPILLYYVLGLVIGTFARRRSVPLLFAGLGWVLLLHLILQPTRIDSLLRIAVIAALLLLVMLGERWLDRWLPQGAVHLGNASYSLYLFHPLIAPAVPAAMAVLGWRVGWLAVLGSCAVAIVASLLLYRFIEEPLTRRLQGSVPFGEKPRRTPGPPVTSNGTAGAVRGGSTP